MLHQINHTWQWITFSKISRKKKQIWHYTKKHFFFRLFRFTSNQYHKFFQINCFDQNNQIQKFYDYIQFDIDEINFDQ